jgi:lipopolysaccharide transport system ATP-binding protein
MPDGEIAVSIRNLSKAYTIVHDQDKPSTLAETVLSRVKHPLRRAKTETFWALKDVSFDIKKGEVVGIIGRNGAGKSTLLKVLSRITEPTAGEIELFGKVGSLLEVGTGFHPELTGRENVYLNGAILGMPRGEIRKQFDAIVDFAGIEQFIDTPVKRYSSGMYVRLAFAVAAHLNSDILIVDEVLSVGDSDFQKKCLGKMGEVAEGGRTVLVVSHNMAVMLRLCQTMVLLERGVLVAQGDCTSVSRQYLQSGQDGRSCVRIWQSPQDAPGDDSARLKSIRVLDAEGTATATIEIRQAFSLEVEYWSLRSDLKLTVSLNVFNEDGVLLFVSNDFNDASWSRSSRTRSVVKANCRIPGNFMAEGRFSVLVAVCTYKPDHVHCQERDAVTFQIFDNSEGDGVRGSYSKAWPGVIRPMLNWNVTTASF